jgi:hypothetical protein
MPTINAREARELVESSAKLLEQRLDMVCEAIRKEATLGSKELLLYPYMFGMFGNASWMVVEKPSAYQSPEMTPVQRLVKKELERLGFTVDIYTYDITLGGGLGDPEPGRPGKAYAIRICW